MMDGQKVKKAIRPRPIGFGFGSGHKPMLARATMDSSGPDPKTNIQNPILKRRFAKSRFMSG
jgi:hypothetical protein